MVRDSCKVQKILGGRVQLRHSVVKVIGGLGYGRNLILRMTDWNKSTVGIVIGSAMIATIIINRVYIVIKCISRKALTFSLHHCLLFLDLVVRGRTLLDTHIYVSNLVELYLVFLVVTIAIVGFSRIYK